MLIRHFFRSLAVPMTSTFAAAPNAKLLQHRLGFTYSMQRAAFAASRANMLSSLLRRPPPLLPPPLLTPPLLAVKARVLGGVQERSSCACSSISSSSSFTTSCTTLGRPAISSDAPARQVGRRGRRPPLTLSPAQRQRLPVEHTTITAAAVAAAAAAADGAAAAPDAQREEALAVGQGDFDGDEEEEQQLYPDDDFDYGDDEDGGDGDGAAGGSITAGRPSSSSDIFGFVVPRPDDPAPTLQLALPPPANVRVKTAEYVKSSVELDQCPREGPPEFAVIGRSNVGKSSLINMLTGRRALAQVSKEPGKTRCINHFTINNGAWYLVDLPGYGYAKRSKDQRRSFDAFTRAYLRGRRALAMVLLLVDASIPPQPVDVDYARWLAGEGVPFSLVFTKADKRKKGGPRARENVAAFRAALVAQAGLPVLPPAVVTSAATGGGRGELLAYIASLRVMFEQSGGGGGGGGGKE